MIFSEINIKAAVSNLTRNKIQQFDYEQLRNLLLERSAVIPIMDEIKGFLDQACADDKHVYRKQAIQSACTAQLEKDKNQVIFDEQESQVDVKETEEFQRLIPFVNQQIQDSTLKISSKTAYLESIQNQAMAIQNDLNNNRNRLDSIAQQKNLLMSHYLNFQVNQHVHGHNSHHTHVHFSVGRPLNYPANFNFWSYTHQGEWNYLNQQELNLNQERRALEDQFALKKREFDREKAEKDFLVKGLNQNVEQLKMMDYKLKTVFPNKETQRKIRHQERIERQEARTKEDLELNQLSKQNRLELGEQISRYNKSLDTKKEILLVEARSSSYTILMDEFENLLKNSKKLTMLETQALIKILELMKNYTKIEKELPRLKRNLAQEKNKLVLLKSNFRDNKQLKKENEHLEAESELCAEARNDYGITGLTTSLAGIVVSILFAALVLNPLLYLLSGAVVLAGIGFLTAATVFHFKKSNVDEQIESNNHHIRLNEGADAQGDSPSMPLCEKIKVSEQRIACMEEEIKDKEESLSSQIAKAKNVSKDPQQCLYPSLFNSSINSKNPLFNTIPSAPEMDEQDSEFGIENHFRSVM